MVNFNIDLKEKTILVTGAAGFIGSHLIKKLCQDMPGTRIIGIDNLNDYYDVRLKESRLRDLSPFPTFLFIKGNIADQSRVESVFKTYHPAVVVNLAAQAGVRYSITNPDAYIESNLIGFYNILEACRHSFDGERPGVEHLVYASSSSVYLLNHIKRCPADRMGFAVSPGQLSVRLPGHGKNNLPASFAFGRCL